MSNLEPKEFHKEILQYVSSYFNQKNPRNKTNNMSLIVHKKKNKDHKEHKYADHNSNYNKYPIKCLYLSNFVSLIRGKPVIKRTSMPDMTNANKHTKAQQTRNVSSSTILKGNYNLSNSKYVSQQRFQDTSKFFNYYNLMTWKVYRCQLITKRETCCCSYNSDAMFEVMKYLYDCYIMKNCDSCDCIICGHEYVKERRFGELNESMAALGRGGKSYKEIEDTIVKAEKAMEGKTLAEKEIILKDLAMSGIPLPEGKTASGNSLINKVRTNLGLPTAVTADDNCKMKKAAIFCLLQPLDGKTPKEKKNILKDLADMGIPLPEGRTASEKEIVREVQAATGLPLEALSERLRKVKAKGLLTPLEGKSPAEKEKVLRGLGMAGLPLPEGKTASERKLINTIRSNLGLPPEPKTLTMREKYKHVAEAGLLHPLEGKTPAEKKRILQRFADLGIPLPKGRTLSENTLIAKVKKECLLQYCHHCMYLLKKGKAKAEGLLSPLQGKSSLEKENILKGLANLGMPFPAGTTDSERMLIDSIRTDLGLPPEPKTALMMDKYTKAADLGLLLPLEGKTPKQKEHILRGLADLWIPLPEGRTASEKALIATVQKEVQRSSILLPSEKQTEKQRKAKAARLLTPPKGKSEKQKENIFKGLANLGMPLPEGTLDSEKKLVNKIQIDLGLPLEPTTHGMKDKFKKAADDVLLLPLEGKSLKEKKDILQGLTDMRIPLPEARTASEKSLIAEVQRQVRPISILTPSEKMRRAKIARLITRLKGKTPAQRENIPKGLAKMGIPLPKGTTDSDKKVLADLGLPPEPATVAMKDKHDKAANAGLLQPLEGKAPREKERIIRGLADMGKRMPRGRTASEKSLIVKVEKEARPPSTLAPFEKKRRTKPTGLITPLTNKTPEQKEKLLKGLESMGITLTKAVTISENNVVNNVRAALGLPLEPTTKAIEDKYNIASAAGLMQPLEGKSPNEKERILRGLVDTGIPLPVGRTASEKSLIAKVKMEHPLSENMRKVKDAGRFTPLEGKSPVQKKKTLKGLVMHGVPLPEGKPGSENELIDEICGDRGLTPEPKTQAIKDKYEKAADIGLLQPFEDKTLTEKERIKDKYEKAADVGLPQSFEGKTPKEKKQIFHGLTDFDIALPEGRTPSEKSLTAKVQKEARVPYLLKPSVKMSKAKDAGLFSPLKVIKPDQKEKYLKDLAKQGISLPEGISASEKNLINKIRSVLDLPPKPTTPEMKDKHAKAADAGLLQPLEEKSPKEKKRIIQGLADMEITLSKRSKAFKKSLIAKVQKEVLAPLTLKPSEKMQQANTEGFLTPVEGKTPEDKKRILKRLDIRDIPQPEGESPKKKKLIENVLAKLGLRPEPTTPEMRDIYEKAANSGVLHILENTFSKEKKLILHGIINMEIPLPDERTTSIKSLIAKVQKEARPLSVIAVSENKRKAKPTSLKTPLKEKRPTQKENILKGLGNLGIPCPEGKRYSGKSVTNKVLADLGLPPTPVTPEMNERYANEPDVALLQPLAGKSPDENEKVLRGLADMGIPLPEGRRPPSQKGLVEKFNTIVRSPSVTTVKLRKTKEAGLLTPLAGKPPEEKDTNIILKDLASIGLVLPKAQTSSEKNTTIAPKKTKAERLKDAKAAGFITPLTGKTPEQKEKITRGLANAGLPLLEAETTPEKIFIGKSYADTGLAPELKAPSMKEKYMKAKAEEFITPLEGKHAAEKEGILKKLQLAGIPVPESRTPGEKSMIKIIKARTPSQRLKTTKEAEVLTYIEGKLAEEKEIILLGSVEAGVTLPKGRTSSMKEMINKVSYNMGQPSEAETKSMKNKMRRAVAAGLAMTLEGKTLPAQADMRIPLPEGRTPSEKSPIPNIKNKAAENLGKAKFAGLFIPIEGKSPADKEKNVSGLAEVELPLPEVRRLSEKSLIRKVKADYGIAPSVSRPSEAAIVRKAKGLLTPSTGKALAQKEKYFEVLQKLGCRYLKVRRYQKEFDKKIRAKVGQSTELTFSERESKIRKRAIDIGTVSKNHVKCVGGIAKEIEDVVKTTVCDHACGCDKKKIRFKRSYIKIRVTSPDMSSSCSCPEKCIPGTKNGDFVDNEGIKDTVVSVIGVSSYSREHTSTVSIRENDITNGKTKSYRYSPVRTYANVVPKKSYNKPNSGIYLGDVYSNLIQSISNTYSYEDFYSDRHVDHASSSPNFSYLAPRLANYYSRKPKSSEDSMTSILIVTSDSPLTLSSDGSIDSISSYKDDSYSDSTIEDSDYITDEMNYYTEDSTKSNISLRIDKLASITCTESELNTFGSSKRSDFIYSSMFEIKLSSSVYAMKQTTESGNSLIVINNISSEKDIQALVDELLSQDVLYDASSVVLLVPASYDRIVNTF